MVGVIHGSHVHNLAWLLGHYCILDVCLNLLLVQDTGGNYLLQPTNELTRVAERLDFLIENFEVGQTSFFVKTEPD